MTLGRFATWIFLSMCLFASRCGRGLYPLNGGQATPLTSISYATNPASYSVSSSFTPNVASVSGGTPTSFAISPALPSSMSLDPTTGTISGPAPAFILADTYLVTAANAVSSVSVNLPLSIFSSATGTIAWGGTVFDGGAFDGLEDAQDLVVSADGNFAYVVAAGADDSVAVFSRDSGTGVLTYQQVRKDSVIGPGIMRDPHAVAMSPDQAHVYVGSLQDSSIAYFSRNPGTGLLTYVGVIRDSDPGVDGLDRVADLQFSSDGFLYVSTDVSSADNSISVFSRNSGTGALTWLQTIKDSDPGVNGLNGGHEMAISPDAAHIYVTGETDDSISWLSRSATTGLLTYSGTLLDGAGGVDGLNGADAVVVSPDGKFVYVGATVDNSIAAFSRNTTTGALTYLQVIKDTDPSVDGLAGNHDIAFSNDGKSLYNCGSADDGLAVITRSASTGLMTFHQYIWDGDPGVDGLNDPQFIAFAPGSNHVYVSAQGDNSITALTRN